jgi:hypothetical protein
MAYIRNHAADVLLSEDFLELSPHCLELILQDDLLRVDEETILTSVLKWASNKCSKKGKEVNAENQRAELGNLLYLIRFPLMGKEYYTDIISEMDILSDKEKVELFKFYYRHLLLKNEVKRWTNLIPRNQKIRAQFKPVSVTNLFMKMDLGTVGVNQTPSRSQLIVLLLCTVFWCTVHT